MDHQKNEYFVNINDHHVSDYCSLINDEIFLIKIQVDLPELVSLTASLDRFSRDENFGCLVLASVPGHIADYDYVGCPSYHRKSEGGIFVNSNGQLIVESCSKYDETDLIKIVIEAKDLIP